MAKEKVEKIEGNEPPEGQSATGGSPEPPQDKTAGKLFSQDELNRIMAERLDRQKRQLEEQMAKDAADAAEWRKYQDGQKTEFQRQAEQLAAEQAARLEAQNRLQAMTIRTAVMAEAAKLNVVDPDAAYRLLDISTIRVGEAGEVLGVGEAMAALVQAKPYLIRTQGPAAGPTANPIQPAAPATTSPGSPGAKAPAQPMGKQIWARIVGVGQSDRLWDATALKAAGGGVFYPKPLEAEEGGPAKPE